MSMIKLERYELTQAIVRELLVYDPKRGTFTHRKRAQHWFASYRSMRSWNARWAGKPAFTCIGRSAEGDDCYHTYRLLGLTYTAHRIAWLYMTGAFPEEGEEIDHRNRNKLDYRWRNLRLTDRAGNGKNRERQPNNTTGRTGVKRMGTKFQARITVDKKPIHIGTFETFDLAVAARLNAERKYGFNSMNR